MVISTVIMLIVVAIAIFLIIVAINIALFLKLRSKIPQKPFSDSGQITKRADSRDGR
jgi:large-conductance mechanosensitive channel